MEPGPIRRTVFTGVRKAHGASANEINGQVDALIDRLHAVTSNNDAALSVGCLVSRDCHQIEHRKLKALTVADDFRVDEV